MRLVGVLLCDITRLVDLVAIELGPVHTETVGIDLAEVVSVIVDTHAGQTGEIVLAVLAVVGDDIVLIARSTVHTNGIVAEEAVDDFLTIGVGAHEVAPAAVLTGKLPFALVHDGFLEGFLRGAGLSDELGIASFEGTVVNGFQTAHGLVGRAVVEFVGCLGIHQQHVGIAHVGVVDTRCAFSDVA